MSHILVKQASADVAGIGCKVEGVAPAAPCEAAAAAYAVDELLERAVKVLLSEGGAPIASGEPRLAAACARIKWPATRCSAGHSGAI